MVLYGIRNCDTVRKARRWLAECGAAYRFHDFRTDGLQGDALDRWCATRGWEMVLNRRGTTWRALPDFVRADVNAVAARALMLEHPTLVKRPVLEVGDQVLIGFDADAYQAALAAAGAA